MDAAYDNCYDYFDMDIKMNLTMTKSDRPSSQGTNNKEMW